MILLTGASGFIGKHLLKDLVNKYAADNVIALTSSPLEGYKYLLHNNYSFNDRFFIETGYDEKIDTIIHAGAFTPKSGAEANDWKLCGDNILNTQKLLNTTLPSLKKIIYLSTLDVYGHSDIIAEDTLTSPISLYGSSKLYCEKMITAWAKAEGKTCQILRVGHVYGPGEEAYLKIIPSVIKKIINNEPVEIWGDGTELRAFIYINDLIKAIVKSLELEEFIGPVNLVSENSISIRNLVEKIFQISSSPINLKMMSASGIPRSLTFDSKKMKQYLLSSETPLDVGLKAEWLYMNLLS
jgi:nucleoside-diphosphate-sugar epimerase